MASGDREIEIKIKVDENDFLLLKEKLTKNARFVRKVEQKDEYFSPAHRDFLEPEFAFEWLSIRERGSKSSLNYKHFYPEGAVVKTHCDEFETIVENPDKLRKLFSALDFKSLITVEKERESYNHENAFEIALDSVKGAGFFVEIEALKDFGSVEETRKKLFAFAKILGLDVSKADNRGYPHMLLKKKSTL